MVLLLELRTELYLLFFLYLWEGLESHPNEHSYNQVAFIQILHINKSREWIITSPQNEIFSNARCPPYLFPRNYFPHCRAYEDCYYHLYFTNEEKTRVFNSTAQGHTASKWLNQDSSPCLLDFTAQSSHLSPYPIYFSFFSFLLAGHTWASHFLFKVSLH